MTEVTETAVGRREQRRRRHQLLSREQLLDAAEEIFGRKGYHETTLKEVAELAEFSVGSVYSFFDNKDDLFRQIFVRRGSQFMEGLRDVLTTTDAPPLEQLHRLVDFEVQWFREHRHFGRLFLRHASASLLPSEGGQDEVILANYAEAMELQADVFRRGQAAGSFRPGPPAVFARLFSGIISSFQALDPAVVSDDPEPEEQLPLADLHDLVEATFSADPARG
jgi:TetR/AcrR family transcriptional regulator